MMGNYAIVETATGIVLNTIVWDGGAELAPDEGCTVIETTTAGPGWTYKDGEFSAPPVEPPTSDEILAANVEAFSALKNQASLAMTPLLLSLQLGDATAAETAAAKKWQAYSRALRAVDLTVDKPAWPVAPGG